MNKIAARLIFAAAMILSQTALAGPLTDHVNTLVTLELHRRGDETDLVLTHERLPTPKIVDGHTKGWGNILDHLAEAISG